MPVVTCAGMLSEFVAGQWWPWWVLCSNCQSCASAAVALSFVVPFGRALGHQCSEGGVILMDTRPKKRARTVLGVPGGGYLEGVSTYC
jgi:hypothetical protein